jgi:hypothetical protein
MPIYNKQQGLSDSWMAVFLRGIVSMLKNLVSVILLLITSIFFRWVNGKQSEYDDLEDKPKH